MRGYPRGKNLPAWLGVALCLALGFVFLCIGTGIEPVEREELKEVTILLDRCVVIAGDYDRIKLDDLEGNRYEIHAANGSQALARKLGRLPAGTELQLLLHPQNDYVLGIYKDGTPILGWQAAQKEIQDEDRAFSWLGVMVMVCGIGGIAGEKILRKKKNRA